MSAAHLEPRRFLRTLFDAAVAAAAAESCVPQHLPEPPVGRTVVVGAGKAAAAMARAVERAWPAELSGLVVTRRGHAVSCESIEVIEAAHPVPDAAGREAAGRVLDEVRQLSSDDLVLCLLSGGGSALLSSPPPWLAFEQKQRISETLLRSGASIADINCVRKHLSSIKGGQLGMACHPARVVTLAISDVPGDDPSVIASGPTVGDPTSSEDALAVLRDHGIELPDEVARGIAENETPTPGDPRFARCEHVVVAAAGGALRAAETVAREHGVEPVVLGVHLEGDARQLAAEHAARARSATGPCVLLSGGETTVKVVGDGRGGRNSEYLLGLAVGLQAAKGVYAIACDTDGIDGTEDNAGAVVTPDTLARASAAGLDADAYLQDNDAYSFFDALGDLVVTGPTLTNVNDLRAIAIV